MASVGVCQIAGWKVADARGHRPLQRFYRASARHRGSIDTLCQDRRPRKRYRGHRLRDRFTRGASASRLGEVSSDGRGCADRVTRIMGRVIEETTLRREIYLLSQREDLLAVDLDQLVAFFRLR